MATEANWPYERIEELEREPEPTWECPEGICTCAETKGGHKDWQFSVMLCEPDGSRMRKARCRVIINGILANEDDPYADGEGWITVVCHHAPSSVFIEWAPHDTPQREPYPHRRRCYVDLREDDPDERVRRRLHNLGFSAQPTLRANVEDFQSAYGYTDVNGKAEDIEHDLVIYHDHAMVPLRDRQSQGGSDERLAFYSPTGESPVAAPAPGGKAVPQPPSAPQGKGQQNAGQGTLVPATSSELDPVIELSGTQTLKPYELGWTEWRQPQIKFRVTIKAPSIRTRIEITGSGGSNIDTDEFTSGDMNRQGVHAWAWDGYGDNMQLDTAVLRAGPLHAKVATWDGQAWHFSRRAELTTRATGARWAEVVVDLHARTARATVFVRFANATIGSLSSAAFAKVRGLILAGIGRYWSRTISVNYRPWTVTVQASARDTDSVPFVLRKAGPEWLADRLSGAGRRCFNPGAAVSGAPVEFFYDEAAPDPDDEVSLVGAHEFGHSILYEASGRMASLTHKGTSSVGQSTLPGAPTYPMAGEIDLMCYYNRLPAGPGVRRGEPIDIYARTIAAEDDVKGLLSIARVEFS